MKDDQYDRLQRAARRLGRTPSELAVTLLEEALRQREFAFIEFRDSPVGRQVYLQGSRLKVWEVVWLAREDEGDVARTAEHFGIPPVQVKAALNYADAYPSEIEAAISDNLSVTVDDLRRLLPELEVIDVDASSP